MTQPLTIGLLGRAGSGKSTAAEWFVKRAEAERFSFARPVKELARRLFHFSDEQVYGTQAQKEAVDPRYGLSPREALIRLGDGARQVIGDEVWIDACFNVCRLSSARVHVIDDVRYPNEARRISFLPNGFVIKLVYSDRRSAADENAPSERSVDEVDKAHIFATVHHWCDGKRSLYAGLSDAMALIEKSVRGEA